MRWQMQSVRHSSAHGVSIQYVRIVVDIRSSSSTLWPQNQGNATFSLGHSPVLLRISKKILNLLLPVHTTVHVAWGVFEDKLKG